MKIAYLNPWEAAAENQAYMSLAAGARKLGLDVIDCRSPEAVEQARPDFVISVASSVPKVSDYPTYLTMHEPTRRFLRNAVYFHNMLSYDGYLTISDSLQRFVRSACSGVGRAETTAFYYITPQRSELQADLPRIVNDGQLKLVYFGTNWDHRLPQLFRWLDSTDILRIHGPQASWETDNYRAYAGPVPFDGGAPQKAYSEAGAGLVLLSADHLREDIISNRIFEIASVGAIAICPDTPWIKKWFGDSVLYFDASGSIPDMARTILGHYKFCASHPDLVQAKAASARSIFEETFSAERLLVNAIAYHEKKQRQRHSGISSDHEPHISVVVRCGG